MEAVFKLEDEALEALRRKYFPRVPWTEQGPVRRRYRVKAAEGESAAAELIRLAQNERFIEPGQSAVMGNARACLDAFGKKAADSSIAMVFGQGLDAHWCDIAFGPADEEGWQEMIIRSEEGENLIALANAAGVLRFRRAEQEREAVPY